MKNSFLQLAIEQKNLSTQTGATLKIRGMASTKNLDRYNEIVEPSAFLDSIDLFMKNPVMLLQHNMNKPIGRFTSLNMTADGLEVEGEVLHNDDGVIDKIKSGVLQAFSIGFVPKRWLIKNPAGEVVADENGIAKGVCLDDLFSSKNTKTITELELVEISVVSIPANAHSLFGISESATKFFDNLQKDWAAEIKTLENPAENIAENADENTPTNEVSSKTENGEISAENDTNIPPSGDELVDTDNVANEVISQTENPADEMISAENSQNEEKNSDETISEKSDENISEKNFSENIENKSFEEISQKNILESKEYKELLAQKEQIAEITKNAVIELEKTLAENAKLKNILQNTPVRKGLVNISGTYEPKQKGFIEKMIDEANSI